MFYHLVIRVHLSLNYSLSRSLAQIVLLMILHRVHILLVISHQCFALRCLFVVNILNASECNVGIPHLRDDEVPPQGGKPGWAALPDPRIGPWLRLLKKIAESHNLVPEFEVHSSVSTLLFWLNWVDYTSYYAFPNTMIILIPTWLCIYKMGQYSIYKHGRIFLDVESLI